MAENIYQLRSTSRLREGTLVSIEGIHDTYGLVVNSKMKPNNEPWARSKPWLNLIRGIGHENTSAMQVIRVYGVR